MGRELKRVALDFDWPLSKTWSGFINPHYSKCHQCTDCGGSGQTIAAQRLGDLVSLLMLSGSDALRGECHPYFKEAPLYNTAGKLCGLDMPALTQGLAGRDASRLMGHDAIDKWRATQKIIAAAGLLESWGECQKCHGEGSIWESKEAKEICEAWGPTEPPSGDGYQIWETVSEGSPISPVFATAEALAAHMATTRWGADQGSSHETWLRFITGPGWAPSAIADERGILDGVQAVAG